MKTNLKEFISKSLSIIDADLEKVLEYFTFNKVKKGTLLLKESEFKKNFITSTVDA